MTVGLTLNIAGIVARGVQRAVFLHPHDKSKLIKVLRAVEDLPRRQSFGGVMDRLFPNTRLRQIRKEYAEYMRVMLAHQEPDFASPIAHMYGFVQTNLGLGCLTENVMEPDGRLGPTLGAKAKAKTLTEQDVDLLNDTITRIYQNDIRASDMNPSNFVFGHRDVGGVLGPRECVLVDGFGDIHAIPVRSMAQWSNRIGLDDSCHRLARNTGLHWDKAHRRFSLLPA